MNTKAKVLFKFGSLEVLCVETRSKKVFKLSLNIIHEKFSCVYTLSHMRWAHTLSLAYETLDYECVH